MTTSTHTPALSALHPPTIRRPALRRRVGRLLTRLYADRPVGPARPYWYAAELPSQRYADLIALSRIR